MKTDNSSQKKQKTIRYYNATAIVETLIALMLLFAIPVDPKNVWLFGFSKTRIGMASILILTLFIFIYLAVKSWKDENWVKVVVLRFEQFLEKYRYFFLLWVISFSIIVFGSYLYLLLNTSNLSTAQGILIRLSPFFLLLFTRIVQLFIVIIVAEFGKHTGGIDSLPTRADLISINSRKIVILLYSLVAIFTMTTIASNVIARITWNVNFGSMLNSAYEKNLPTFFSALILCFAALLLALIATLKGNAKDSFFIHWSVLSIIFLYLSVDEMVGIHEAFEEFIKMFIDPGGIIHFIWVIPGTIFILIFAISFFRFFQHLPSDTKKGFLIAAVIYVGAALGFEFVEGWYKDTYGIRDANNFIKPVYQMMVTLEESLEMVGVVIFIYTLLQYIGAKFDVIKIWVKDANKDGVL